MRTNGFPSDHVSRRALMKGMLATATGGVVMNWGGLAGSRALAAEVREWRQPMGGHIDLMVCPGFPAV